MKHRSYCRQFLALLICVAALASAGGHTALALPPIEPARTDLDPGTAFNWYIQTVGAPPQRWLQAPGARMLAADAAGVTHLAYGGDHLYYARNDGPAWRRETVDGADHVGAGASLALDRQGFPRISYCDQGNGTAKIAAWQGLAWETRALISDGGCVRTALALDAADVPHVVWVTDSDAVKYATWDGRDWAIRTIGAGRLADLALDPAGQPHIVYDHATALAHAWRDGEGWHEEPIMATGDFRRPLSVSAAFRDDLAIAFVLAEGQTPGVRSSHLGYARRSDGGWVFAENVRLGSSTAAVSLALDTAGAPHIGYRDGDALHYRRWTEGGWLDQAVERVPDGPDADWCAGIGLAVDVGGAPHLGYLKLAPPDGTGARQEGMLRYVTARAGAWAAQAVDTAHESGLRGALALDIAGDARLSGRDGRGALRYAAWSNGWWTSETADAATGPVFGRTVLALDPTGTPSIGYVATDGALKLARRTAAGWQTTTVARPGAPSPGDASPRDGYVADFALALDRAGSPHIGYLAAACATCEPMLRYASQGSGGWEVQDVDTIPARAYAPHSLALQVDAAGGVHLLYEAGGTTLRYARSVGGGWAIREVAGGLAEGRGIALALDGGGNPHAIYLTATDVALAGLLTEPALGAQSTITTLRYAALRDGRWQAEAIATGDIRSPALQLDTAGAPHVSFVAARDPGRSAWEVRYAERTAAAWRTRTVDVFHADAGLNEAELWTALALDRNGRPAIAYYDLALHAARYAIGGPRIAAPDCGPAPTPGAMTAGTLPSSGTITRQIGHCLDDAHVALGSTTELQNGGPYVRMGGRPGVLVPYVSYVDGLLFRDVAVPQGAQIVSATLTLKPWFQAAAAVVEVAGERSPQAEDFRGANPWPHERPRTAQRVPWIIGGVVTGAADAPDLALIIEEIVSQADWQPGNNLALLVSALPAEWQWQFVDWQAYDFSPANAAQLSISYRIAETATPTPTVTATATPTATPSPTATPTPRPERGTYLPLVLGR
jgi:hypothetical protein